MAAATASRRYYSAFQHYCDGSQVAIIGTRLIYADPGEREMANEMAFFEILVEMIDGRDEIDRERGMRVFRIFGIFAIGVRIIREFFFIIDQISFCC